MICSLIYFFIKLLIVYLSVKLAIVYYKKKIRKPLDLSKRYGKNSYALITGGTSGIGKEFCFQLAKLGFNLIIVSRNMKKLSKVSTDIKLTNPTTEIKLIEFDFAKNHEKKIYLDTFNSDELKRLDISIIINNIGISERNLFKDYSLDYISESINVNVLGPSFLTHILINKLLRRKNKSAIIFMSSASSKFPLAYSSLYCSTKIYDDYLLRSIAYENALSNVDFLSVRPFYVDTPSRKGHKREFAPITCEECVKGVFQDIGYENISYGHWKHYVLSVFFGIVPEIVQNYIRIFKSKTKQKIE